MGLLFREPQAGAMRQGELAEWTSEGKQKRATGVWETERLSVNKAGICTYAQRGRERVKQGGTAEQSVPAE